MKNTTILQMLGNNLRLLRRKNNLSQLDLSTRTGLSNTFINNIENGKKWVSAETLSILSETLHASPYEFFLDDGVPALSPEYLLKNRHTKMILELDEMVSRYKKEIE